ncbi:MAG TPA: nucleoside triphosphate pyrophosphatase [Polyangiaceae bacterium]|nr:nucleoside triphosphate pyrophosphatase [Polyangiaceae bacterium]
MRIVLASTSRYRRELIQRLGLGVESAAPAFDEEAEKKALEALSPEALVASLARGKARSLGEAYPDALIIGSDQAAEVDGELLGKPGTEEAARAQLRLLSGREHRLLTAVAVFEPRTGRLEEALDVHRLSVRALSDEAIARYVRLDRPLDCAGSYRVEALGIALFDRLSGDDFTAIIGLPLTRVVALLDRFGVRVLEGEGS